MSLAKRRRSDEHFDLGDSTWSLVSEGNELEIPRVYAIRDGGGGEMEHGMSERILHVVAGPTEPHETNAIHVDKSLPVQIVDATFERPQVALSFPGSTGCEFG